MNRRALRLHRIRQRARVVGVAADPEPTPPDLIDEIACWRRDATSASFRTAASPLASVLGQRGRW